MHVVVLASRKGGVGKTTLSANLAISAATQHGYKVAIMDADPMANLAAWWNARIADTPIFINADDHGGVRQAVSACEQAGINLLIIDTPPSISSAIDPLLREASLVVVPVTPSPNDLRGVGATIDAIDRLKLPMIFVINDAMQRARITADTAVALSQHGPIASVIIHSRTDFRASMIDGRTVAELDAASKSAQEINELWLFIHTRLEKEKMRVVAAI